jgi:hypothetical protein
MGEYERNQEAAQRICRELRWNGRSFKLGDYFALLDGNVIPVAGDPREALRALRSVDPDIARGMILEVAALA